MPRDIMQALEKELKRAEHDTLYYAQSLLIKLSSGPYKTKNLRAMYNPKGPYSVADPHPPAHPGIINEQSGDFKGSWVVRLNYGVDWKYESGWLENFSKHAPFLLEGTRKMIRRTIFELIQEKVEAHRITRITEAFAKVLS